MLLSKQVKAWLVENKYASDGATDAEFKEALGKAIKDGKLDAAAMVKLMDEPADDNDPIKAIEAIVAKAVAPLAAKVETLTTKTEKPEDVLAKTVDEAVTKAMSAFGQTAQSDSITTPEKMFGGSGKPDVKSPVADYSAQRSNLSFPMNHKAYPGRQATYADMPLESSSQRDLAIAGAYFKFAASRGGSARDLPRGLRMTDHDTALLKWALHNEPWTGIIHGDGSESPGSYQINGRKLHDFEIKALLDDTASGGLEAAPIVFDNAVITTPVLYGELFPLINVVPIARGRRVEGFSIGNPTFTSGTAEGTEISLFDTSTFIAAFDTTIYNAVGAMEIGNDFQEDSPVNIGALVTKAYGEKAQEWLDNQIVNGDGLTEPQGVGNATGKVDIGNPAGGANQAPQVVDFEKLLFGVTKPYRPPQDRARCVFIMNDTSYQRARSIAEATGWQTRALGMTHEDYQILGHKACIQNDTANTVCYFANLRYYRMYRRLGLNVRVETGGKELARKNLTLIVVRMRWGGKMETGSAASYSDNWQT